MGKFGLKMMVNKYPGYFHSAVLGVVVVLLGVVIKKKSLLGGSRRS